jgi:hypothetical protein
VIKVAESGIKTREDVERLRAAGFNAFLVGESLLRQNDRAAVRALLVRRKLDLRSDTGRRRAALRGQEPISSDSSLSPRRRDSSSPKKKRPSPQLKEKTRPRSWASFVTRRRDIREIQTLVGFDRAAARERNRRRHARPRHRAW